MVHDLKQIWKARTNLILCDVPNINDVALIILNLVRVSRCHVNNLTLDSLWVLLNNKILKLVPNWIDI